MDAQSLQRLIDQTAAQQRRLDRQVNFTAAGDVEAARFLDLPPQMQQTLLLQQDYQDATDAARIGDQAGARAALASAVNRQLAGARPHPRRRNPR